MFDAYSRYYGGIQSLWVLTGGSLSSRALWLSFSQATINTRRIFSLVLFPAPSKPVEDGFEAGYVSSYFAMLFFTVTVNN